MLHPAATFSMGFCSGNWEGILFLSFMEEASLGDSIVIHIFIKREQNGRLERNTRYLKRFFQGLLGWRSMNIKFRSKRKEKEPWKRRKKPAIHLDTIEKSGSCGLALWKKEHSKEPVRQSNEL